MADFLWYDLETFGTNPALDRIAQFAAIRTDSNLEVIAKHDIYCQSPTDRLPNPYAVLTTGITPQIANAKGVRENQFAEQIFQILAEPNTCRVGYNSIKFDDEMCRNLFYRNFFPIYDCEWKNGNTRWDLLDVVRLVYATKPDTLNWPTIENKVVFKLDKLSQENQLSHNAPHEAVSDIIATIALAKIIKTKQPKLFEYCFNLRKKNNILDFLAKQGNQAFLHISGKYSVKRACAAMVCNWMQHPIQKNSVLFVDISQSPKSWFDLSVDQIKLCLFGTNEQLAEQQLTRLPISLVNISQAPIIAPKGVVNAAVAERMQLDVANCHDNLTLWLNNEQQLQNLRSQIKSILSEPIKWQHKDAEQLIYQSFVNDSDAKQFYNIRNGDFADCWLQDARLRQLLLRYKAQHFPKQLSADEKAEWHSFCQNNLSGERDNLIGLKQYQAMIDQLKQDYQQQADKIQLLEALLDWQQELQKINAL